MYSFTEKTRDKENNDKLFNFRSKSHEENAKLQITPETSTTESCSNRSAAAAESSTKDKRYEFESSSVFHVPNATDDIICLEDSEPFLMPSLEDLADQFPPKLTEFKHSPEKPVRIEFRERTKRNEAAQLGHVCPECKDVSIFLF